MKWTKEPPSKAGWYWCREPCIPKSIIEVRSECFGDVFVYGEHGCNVADISMEWAGPITEPDSRDGRTEEAQRPADRLVSCADMVHEYLISNNYDGLVDDGRECACCIEDLMPCGGEGAMTCEAGYRKDGCNADCSNGCDFHIVPGRDCRDSDG